MLATITTTSNIPISFRDLLKSQMQGANFIERENHKENTTFDCDMATKDEEGWSTVYIGPTNTK